MSTIGILGFLEPGPLARWIGVLLVVLVGLVGSAQATPANVDVVVVVDTSVSMKQPGMDPERSSLLVTKLLTDLVPGHLSIVRLLGIAKDEKWLPRKETNERSPCHDDPSKQCTRVIPKGDWEELVRKNLYGVKERPARGDQAFKQSMDSHLSQEIGNSSFTMAFRGAQGVFYKHGNNAGSGIPRMVVWLSDGQPEHPSTCRRVLDELKRDGVALETVLFGKGDDSFARAAGLSPRRASNPREMMKAFAGLFRHMVQAPYELDGEIAQKNNFEMHSYVDEAWVVVYGDKTLGDVTLAGPDGTNHPASYANDMLATAGAYKVAHFLKPKAGRYSIQVQGGGLRVAFAVVQRSSLSPYLIAPRQTLVGVEVLLTAGIRAGTGGEQITRKDLLATLSITAEVEGKVVTLRDDGTGGDKAAGDGTFTGKATFTKVGKAEVKLRAKSDLVDRTSQETVDVTGKFENMGGPVTVDLGTLTEGATSCKPLVTQVKQQGILPLDLKELKGPPGSHSLKLQSARGDLLPDGDPVSLPPGEPLMVCLTTGSRAASSKADGEPWLELRASGTTGAKHAVTIHLRWQVDGLSWLERWLWLILTILGILLLIFILLGFILPKRFPRGLAVGLAQDREDLDDISPSPIKRWKGVGIGFYRHARAFILPSFRITGKSRGAVVKIFMTKSGLYVSPVGGASMAKDTLDDEWKEVKPEGARARGGDVYRVGHDGFYFSISMRGGRR